MSKILHYHRRKGLFWFRLFGHGLFFKNTMIHDMMFSEKYGHRSLIVINGWLIRVLGKSEVKT